MRTKTLLLTAALSAAGLATSMAQSVFSVNAVGYVNVELPEGFSMIANPLVAADNTVAALFANAGLADGTVIYKFNSGTGSYDINAYDFGEFANPAMTLVPGEGAFVLIPAGGASTVTFVGEVSQGSLSHAVPAGFSIQSSEVPQSGQLDTILGFPATDGDVVYRFSNATGNYAISAFDFGDWDNAPVPAVGESFFVNKVAATDWTRSFSVNN
jgi:hypothetical protein